MAQLRSEKKSCLQLATTPTQTPRTPTLHARSFFFLFFLFFGAFGRYAP